MTSDQGSDSQPSGADDARASDAAPQDQASPQNEAAQEDEAFPHENPNRPREYHGARTVVVALLVLAAVALPLWLAFGSGEGPRRSGDFGVVERPSYLNPARLQPDDAIGRLAPDFELETLDGGRFRLSDWAGHPVVVNFWASWCTPCRREMPVLIRLQEQYRAQGLIVVGVNIEEARAPADDFAVEFGINFVLPMDFRGDVTRRYGIQGQLGPPHTMFVGPDGVIRDIFRGQGPDATFEQVVLDLLSTLTDPLGPALLPGPKALPADRRTSDVTLGSGVGQLAPDVVLVEADDPARRWRLSEQRGRALLLLFVRPDCVDCDDELRRAVSAAAAAGVGPVIIRPPSPRLATASAYTSLLWERDSAALFAAGAGVAYVLIDAMGIVEALPSDDAEAASLLAARESAPG